MRSNPLLASIVAGGTELSNFEIVLNPVLSTLDLTGAECVETLGIVANVALGNCEIEAALPGLDESCILAWDVATNLHECACVPEREAGGLVGWTDSCN